MAAPKMQGSFWFRFKLTKTATPEKIRCNTSGNGVATLTPARGLSDWRLRIFAAVADPYHNHLGLDVNKSDRQPKRPNLALLFQGPAKTGVLSEKGLQMFTVLKDQRLESFLADAFIMAVCSDLAQKSCTKY